VLARAVTIDSRVASPTVSACRATHRACDREGDLRDDWLRRKGQGLLRIEAVTAVAVQLCPVIRAIMTDRRNYLPQRLVILPSHRTGIFSTTMTRSGEFASDGFCVRRLTGGPTVEAAVLAVAAQVHPFVLESTAPDHRNGRYSILGFDPVEAFELAEVDGGWIDSFAQRVGQPALKSPVADLPFVGGWVGFISYEAGLAIENVRGTKPRDLSLPLVRFALYDTVAIFDHHWRRWTVAGVELDKRFPNRQHLADRVEKLEALLLNAPRGPTVDWSRDVADEPAPVMSRGEYIARVTAAKRHIEAGDVYQVNLTQRFTGACRASPLEVYRRLRVANPAPLGAYLDYGDAAIISASPELFLSLRNGRIVTRPIKGTRHRVGDEVLDKIQSQELLASEKDRAELNMIIDVERNDLGRVAAFGSVRVVSAGELEAHPTVFHRVASVEGSLRSGLTWADLLRASFPGGSITGAPKIRAMQIIDDLEVTQRSVYCGSIGYIGLDGSMCLNIAIRTMVLDRGRIHLFGGGGIVADSDPEDEYEETLVKVAGLVRALHARDEFAYAQAPQTPR